MRNLLWLVICSVCAALFLGLGINILKQKTPVNFWSGTIVKSEDVTDISAYNKENAIMWSVYSIPYWICGIVGTFSLLVAVIIMLLACSVGVLLLIKNYKRIEKKYLEQK